MNQILSTKLNKKTSNKKNWFKFQFTISIFILFLIFSFGFFYYYNLIKKEKVSNDIISNYDIYRLYSKQNSDDEIVEENFNGLFGIIEIPKLNIYYPIFSEINEELLKIAPCKFYGKSLDKFGNICIAGHNYHNSSFFSRLSTLVNNDEIYIYDNIGNKYTYLVNNVYQVEASDFSPVFNYSKTEKIITLFTCDNTGSNRTIVKAKQKDS